MIIVYNFKIKNPWSSIFNPPYAVTELTLSNGPILLCPGRVILRTVLSRCCQMALRIFRFLIVTLVSFQYPLLTAFWIICPCFCIWLAPCFLASCTFCIFSSIFSAVHILDSSELRTLLYLPYCLVPSFSYYETFLYSQSSHFYLWLTRTSNWVVWFTSWRISSSGLSVPQ